jgi:V-type H+-transporting ATPase subunit E
MLANKTRLRVLSARQALLDELFECAREKITGAATQPPKKKNEAGGAGYQAILKGLILEGLYALNEDKVAVRARTKDYDIVKKAIADASKEFKEVVGRDIAVEIDKEEPLPESS